MQSDTSSAADSPFEATDKIDDAELAGAMRTVPLGAAVLAGSAFAMLVVQLANRHAAEGVIETAEQADDDLIVMGSHGRSGANLLLLGATALRSAQPPQGARADSTLTRIVPAVSSLAH